MSPSRIALALVLSIGGAHLAQAQRTYCVPDGLQAYLTFEQTHSSRAGGAANPNGTDPQPGFATDARVGNYAATFDGEDDRLRYGFLNAGFVNMTVMLWVRPTDVGGLQTLFEEGGLTNGVALRLNGATLEAAVREEEVQVTVAHGTPVEAGTWQHVALVYEAGTVTLYLNGTAAADAPDTGFGALASHTNNGGFGATLENDAFGEGSTTTNSATHFFAGLIDEAAYYRGSAASNALTEEQIDATIACDPSLPFVCNADVYVAQGNQSSLRRIDVTTSPFTFITVDDPVPFEYNAAGYNPLDDFAYAFRRGSSDRRLLRIAADGTLTDLGSFPQIAGGNADIYSGDVSPDGILYLAHLPSGSDRLSAIDLTVLPYTVESLDLDQDFDAADLAFNPVDGLLYGVASGTPDLVAVDPTTGMVTRTAIALPNGGSLPSGDYGAAWFNALGQLFAYRNTGRIYRIDVSSEEPSATLVSTGPSVSRNDGFACATAPVAADVSVDKEVEEEPAPPVETGDAFAYTIDVVNGGPAIATNVVVEDVLPPGLTFVEATVDSLSSGVALNPDRFALDAPAPGTNGTVTLSLSDLALGTANGVRLTLYAEATEALPDLPTNTATIVAADQDDPDGSNDQDSAGGVPTATESHATPAGYRLEAPHPNPFRHRTTLHYTLPEPTAVTVEVFDVTGRRIAVLVDREQPAGRYAVAFDASDLAAGVYLCVLRAGSGRLTRWLTRVR